MALVKHIPGEGGELGDYEVQFEALKGDELQIIIKQKRTGSDVNLNIVVFIIVCQCTITMFSF